MYRILGSCCQVNVTRNGEVGQLATRGVVVQQPQRVLHGSPAASRITQNSTEAPIENLELSPTNGRGRRNETSQKETRHDSDNVTIQSSNRPSEDLANALEEPDGQLEISQAWDNLRVACEGFVLSYSAFTKTNKTLLKVEPDQVLRAIRKANTKEDVQESSKTFRIEIVNVLQAIEAKKNLSEKRWSHRVGVALFHLYPCLRVCLSAATLIGEGAKVSPLKAVAEGIGILLQAIEDDNTRRADIVKQLSRIERIAVRFIENSSLQTRAGAWRIQARSVDALSAIVRLFEAALVYKSITVLSRRPKKYEDAKSDLDLAIQEYDQAIWDLTLCQALKAEQESQSEELLRWLSASYWIVESRLQSSRDKRAPGTLTWAHQKHAFKTWRTSEYGSVLWIRGGPGIGKSTMAGYFIDELKRQYRKSVIAYFFCAREEPGLSDVRDVIRTIAYQCALRCTVALKALQELMIGLFEIEERVSVHLMIKKLLEEPLKETTQDVFIVIDGLDELGHELPAEGQQSAPSDKPRNRAQERSELIQYLGELVTNKRSSTRGSVRLLLLSRPEIEVQRLVPESALWLFDYDDNSGDIQLYVKQQLGKFGGELQTWFDAVSIEPLKYFRDNSGGLFLWVSTVLGELGTVKFQETFSELLDQFSKSSGDMNKIYIDVFARIAEKDRPWVREIMKWLVMAQRTMKLEELQAAVECDMGKHFMKSKFKSFVNVECGSLVRSIAVRDMPVYAVLIHETLVSFLTDRTKCPQEFWVDISSACEDVACTCLKVLCKNDDYPEALLEYSARFWASYLVFLPNMGSKGGSILNYIYKLFTSKFALERWIKFGLLTEGRLEDELPIHVEEEDLEEVTLWLIGCHLDASQLTHSANHDAFQWASDLPDADELGAIIGKVAAELWMSGQLQNRKDNRAAFRLALKYYFKSIGNQKRKLEELRQLTRTHFSPLLRWATSSEPIPAAIDVSLGDAFSVIRRWNQALFFYTRAIQENDGNLELWQLVSSIYESCMDQDSRKAEGAIEFFEKMIRKFPEDLSPRYLLGAAYEEVDNLDKAVEVYETIIELKNELSAWRRVGRVYERQGEFDKALALYKTAQEKGPLPPPQWSPIDVQLEIELKLGNVYVLKRDLDEALIVYKTIAEKEPYCIEARDGLAKVYRLKGMWDEAIATYETLVEDFPKEVSAWNRLIELHKQRHDSVAAIEGCRLWRERDPNNTDAVISLGRLYQSMGQFQKALECYESVPEPPVRDENAWKYIGRSYVATGEFDKAISLYRSLLQKSPKAIIVWRDLVEVHMQKGDEDGARAECEKWAKVYEKMIEEDPTDPEVLGQLGMVYQATGSLDRAIEMYEAVNEISSDSMWLMRLGHAYRAKGDLSKAIGLYEKSTELGMRDSVVHDLCDVEHCVTCDGCGENIRGLWYKCETCNDYDLCNDCYTRVNSLHPQHKFFRLPSDEWILQFEQSRKKLEIGRLGIECQQ